MESKKFEIVIALYPFTCPHCGMRIRKGENYVVSDGLMFCLKVLPERRLTKLQKTIRDDVRTLFK
jgi:hypothetical protein